MVVVSCRFIVFWFNWKPRRTQCNGLDILRTRQEQNASSDTTPRTRRVVPTNATARLSQRCERRGSVQKSPAVIVHRSIVDRFLLRFTEELGKLKVGDVRS